MEKDTINNNSTTLVTAIYGYGPNSEFGGRGRDIYFYNSVLRAISDLQLPIVIYARPDSIENIEHYVSSYLQNYKIIPYELTDFIYCNEILQQKREMNDTSGPNDRNHILCYNKLFWVKDAAEKDLFKTDKFLWIDCGLFHHGIIPEKVGGVELTPAIIPSLYYPENTNSIFNPTFGSKLDKFIKKNKILACAHPAMGYLERQLQMTNTVFNCQAQYVSNHIIGGIFGGYKNTVDIFFNMFKQILKYNVDNKYLLLEEPLFSCIEAAVPDLFDLQHFYHWYYYSPGERCSYLSEEGSSYGQSFYKIFTNIYES